MVARTFTTIAVIALAVASAPAQSAQIYCQDTTKNHMGMDDGDVGACLDSGLGNINGNDANDVFLNGVGTDYFTVTKSDDSTVLFGLTFTQNGSTGTFSFDASFWDVYGGGAIGFKFGTGNRPDSWFVFSLLDGVSSGNWDFFNMFRRGGGLSHVNLYASREVTEVPEPAALGLFGFGLLLLAANARRRARA